MNKRNETTTLNKTQGEIYYLPCLNCSTETRHTAIVTVDVESDVGTSVSILSSQEYQIVQCNGCDTLSFRECSDTEMSQRDLETGEIVPIGPTVHLFPRRIGGNIKLSEYIHFTEGVEAIFDETVTALFCEQPILAGIGIRTLVEAVCRDTGAEGRNLEIKIDSLATAGFITFDSAEMLHSLRILGNTATHETAPHSQKTLEVAFEVIETLLRNVYILPEITAILPKPSKLRIVKN